jgi:transcriptional regulator with XRE-family HTH domain
MDRSANQIGCYIRAVRKARRYTLQELADRAGASKSYVWELERGRGSRPSAQMLSRIAAALGVTLESVLGDKDYAASADKIFFKKYQALNATSKNIFRRLADLLADQSKEN